MPLLPALQQTKTWHMRHALLGILTPSYSYADIAWKLWFLPIFTQSFLVTEATESWNLSMN
jgi:hypothetical protein